MAKLVLSSDGSNADPAILEEWIRNAKQGDLTAFRKVYDQYARRVLNFIYRMMNSSEEAEDLMQETFVAVYRSLPSLKDDTRFEPWLFRIARNLVYQRYRSKQPETVSIDAQDEDGQPPLQLKDTRKNPDEAFQAEELEAVVQKVILQLPEKYREVFVLSALQKLSYQEISEIVGRSLPSVKTDIHRARLEVRQHVKDYLKVSK